MGLAYFLYAVSIIYESNQKLGRIIKVGLIPGAAYMVLIMLNPLTKNIFDITADKGYVRGSLISVTYVVFYAYCLASIVITAVNYNKMDRKIRRILASFPVLAVLVIIVQQDRKSVV